MEDHSIALKDVMEDQTALRYKYPSNFRVYCLFIGDVHLQVLRLHNIKGVRPKWKSECIAPAKWNLPLEPHEIG